MHFQKLQLVCHSSRDVFHNVSDLNPSDKKMDFMHHERNRLLDCIKAQIGSRLRSYISS